MTKKWDKIFTKELLEEKYKEFGEIKKIAEYFNCHTNTITYYIKKFNLKINRIYKSKYLMNENFFKNSNELSYYWSGFIAADGSINTNKKYTLTIELCDRDRLHLEKFKTNLECNIPLYDRSRKSSFSYSKDKIYNSSILKINSKQIVEDLRKFNVIQNKTYIYTLPEFLKNDEYVKNFIRGYWEGDGSICLVAYKKIKLIPMISLIGNKDFLESILFILEKNLQINPPKIKLKQNTNYQFTFNKRSDILKILHYLYDDATIYLDRKYEKAKYIMENY